MHYFDIWQALEQALAKVKEYYEKSANSNAYTFAMGMFIIHRVICVTSTYLSVGSPQETFIFQEALGGKSTSRCS
jgi:hypothetical protein